jgi:hypothetical protein
MRRSSSLSAQMNDLLNFKFSDSNFNKYFSSRMLSIAVNKCFFSLNKFKRQSQHAFITFTTAYSYKITLVTNNIDKNKYIQITLSHRNPTFDW